MSRLIYFVTEDRYIRPNPGNSYVENIFREDELLGNALACLGYEHKRVSWRDHTLDWEMLDWVLLRTTWDYFDHFDEFSNWLQRLPAKACMNPKELLSWNTDKHYLLDLARKGVRIVPTTIIPRKHPKLLSQWAKELEYQHIIVKPTIAGAARLTYRLEAEQIPEFDSAFTKLNTQEDFILQPFVPSVTSFGELSLMVMGGTCTHAVQKCVKKGDFRVQDDFGGTVHYFTLSPELIELAESVIEQVSPQPLYGRVDIMRNDDDEWMVSELELIEPELWFRTAPKAVEHLAKAIHTHITHHHENHPNS
jgi:glutathione synthase/RimK-type ligase-like ATP-grasp enzyme